MPPLLRRFPNVVSSVSSVTMVWVRGYSHQVWPKQARAIGLLRALDNYQGKVYSAAQLCMATHP
jgi:hypothetical protein